MPEVHDSIPTAGVRPVTGLGAARHSRGSGIRDFRDWTAERAEELRGAGRRTTTRPGREASPPRITQSIVRRS